ncbi:hypothetical protein Tco_0606191 [Tanacetum coccineum]
MIGLGYESIHACEHDCCLFRGDDNKDLDFCPVCNTSRWKDSNTPGKKVPKKVLRYFLIIPRLQRLYKSSHTAKEMIWHATRKCTEPGKMQHPVDGRAWKNFDTKYPDFAKEPRNVRLGLAADGFNPFGNLSQAYSMWPVILTTYNLPPWLCMKESSFMLTLLIPGPKSPGKDIDVYLRPFKIGTAKGFNGTGKGVETKRRYKACPTCNKDTPSVRVLSKTAYVGHKRFLKKPHKWRSSREFNGQTDNRDPPKEFGRDEILAQLDRLPTRLTGKHPSYGGVKIKCNVLIELNWTKRSIFYELEYWSFLTLRHNLDIMHIEKKLEAILNTLLMNEKSKDTAQARQDKQSWHHRSGLWLTRNQKRNLEPQAAYSFTPENRKKFCQYIKGVKLPDGFGSCFKHKVTDNDTNIALKALEGGPIPSRLFPNKDMKEEFPVWFGSQIRQRHVDNDKEPELQEILEFKYLLFKVVLFRVKWFDTRNQGRKVKRLVLRNNMTQIDTRAEAFKDDQYILDDPDIIHFDNSSDLPLSTSLNDLDNATLHIDGQSTEVDTSPDIIDVMSADVARSHGGDDGGEDRPPPHYVPSGCRFWHLLTEVQWQSSGTYGVPVAPNPPCMYRGRPQPLKSTRRSLTPSSWHTLLTGNSFRMRTDEEMRRLEATSTYTDDEINHLARRGKQRGHIPGVGRVLPARATTGPTGGASGSGGCGDGEESADDQEDEDEDGDGDS